MTHKGCVLQRVFFDAISDVTVVLWIKQSIGLLIWTPLLSAGQKSDFHIDQCFENQTLGFNRLIQDYTFEDSDHIVIY